MSDVNLFIFILGGVFAAIFGFGHGILFYLDRSEMEILPKIHMAFGSIYLISPLIFVFIPDFLILIPVIIFFGGQLILVLSLLFLKEKIQDERTDYFLNKMDRVKGKDISVFDLFKGKLLPKLLLQKGAAHTSKVLIGGISLTSLLTFFLMNLVSGEHLEYPLISFIVFITVFSTLTYHSTKKKYSRYLSKFRVKNDDLFENW